MQLYIHVPFCISRCRYCSFYSQALPKGASRDELINLYAKGLTTEIALWSERLGKLTIDTIFFGGGTPSILPAPLLGKIMDSIRKHFSVFKGAEISLEGNPESMLEFGYAAEIAALGVNRLSLGIQSMDDDMLKFLGRPHTVREARAAYEAARVCGINNISLDLIWGLPGQRLRLWLDELKSVTDMKPDHLSCYNLTLEDDSPLAKAHADGLFTLPDDNEQAAMYKYGNEFLESRGFLHYEISNYARMGFKCLHNLGYWEGRDYLGIGPSAVSTIKDRRWTNPADMRAWAQKVMDKTLGHDQEVLDHVTRVIELIMLRLRTDRGLRLKAYTQLTGRDFIADNKAVIQVLHQKGMLRIRNGYLSLTGSGMLVSNSILEFLFNSTREKLGAGSDGSDASGG